MFAVTVTFHIQPGQMAAFLPLMLSNASASRKEPGCRQFDVCTDPAHNDEVFLYELYTDSAAFDAHLAAPHFKEFAAQVDPMISRREVRTYATVQQ